MRHYNLIGFVESLTISICRIKCLSIGALRAVRVDHVVEEVVISDAEFLTVFENIAHNLFMFFIDLMCRLSERLVDLTKVLDFDEVDEIVAILNNVLSTT